LYRKSPAQNIRESDRDINVDVDMDKKQLQAPQCNWKNNTLVFKSWKKRLGGPGVVKAIYQEFGFLHTCNIQAMNSSSKTCIT